MEFLAAEHAALCRHLAQAQQRCSAALQHQQHALQALQALQMALWRTRVRLLLRTTEAAWLREDLHALQARVPGRPQRRGTAAHLLTAAGPVAPSDRQAPPVTACASLAPPAREPARGPAHGAGWPQDGGGAGPGPRGSAALQAVAEAAAQAALCQTACVAQAMVWRGADGVCERTGAVCVAPHGLPPAGTGAAGEGGSPSGVLLQFS